MRDVYGLVADALQVAVDARNGQQKAQIGRHGSLQGEQALDALVDFDLHLVDGVFFVEHRLGEPLIGVQHGVNGLMDGALGKAAHPQQPLLQFFEIVFPMAFHGYSAPFIQRKQDHTAQTKHSTDLPEVHPKRPVMYASVRGSGGVVNSFDVSMCSISFPSSMNAVKSLARAACCMLWVTIAIVQLSFS